MRPYDLPWSVNKRTRGKGRPAYITSIQVHLCYPRLLIYLQSRDSPSPDLSAISYGPFDIFLPIPRFPARLVRLGTAVEHQMSIHARF